MILSSYLHNIIVPLVRTMVRTIRTHVRLAYTCTYTDVVHVDVRTSVGQASADDRRCLLCAPNARLRLIVEKYQSTPVLVRTYVRTSYFVMSQLVHVSVRWY
jgi:hypothetical protein